MSLFKGIFGNKKAGASAPAVGKISAVPGQSDEEKESIRAKMQAEVDAAKAARASKSETATS